MRKANKQNLLEIMKTLREANGEAVKYIENNDKDTAIVLLTECQNAAIGMGENIEAFEGEDAPTIAYLQEYCEVLYQAAVAAEAGEDYVSRFEALDKALQKIGSSIENDIKVRKEIVFLPYKASMWDCLESVWKAAAADPDCDAYVVPIPYYDRYPDGSFGQLYYEGKQFPKEVPITSFRDYNLAEHRPDVIFIHNPYDDANYVTSVHPTFYSKNLKQYTELLVYVPYFVLAEIEPDDREAIEKMKHFCFSPGIVNADRIILQSENMRQIYISEYAKVAKGFELRTDREFLEKKFLGLGSPKLDKMENIRREDFEIPEEWQRYIGKLNGERKRIVLYNNSISTLLRYGEKMIEKYERVLEVFKEQQDDIVLWWRPHPLIMSTIKAMRPQLWDRYSRIVEKYRSEDWGIYDDTGDLDRALVCTDAYYGDPSSLVQLYRKTGKPIMIQQVEVI